MVTGTRLFLSEAIQGTKKYTSVDVVCDSDSFVNFSFPILSWSNLGHSIAASII